MRGPIDYIFVGFKGNKFDGSILKAVSNSIEQGVISLIALSVIRKDKDGEVTVLDVTDLGDDYAVNFVERHPGSPELVTSDDIDEMAELLENDTAAGILIVEQLWAVPLKRALLKANGVLIADGRIHPDAAVELSR